MALFPSARLVPFTVSVAAIAAPEVARFAIPREVPPEEKTTVPVGKMLPEAGFTIAVNTVDALCSIAAGFAVTVVVVATGGGAMVMITGVAVEPPKLLLPA